MSKNKNLYESPFTSKGRKLGVTLTIIIHASLLMVFVRAEINPTTPAEDKEIIIEFIEEEPKIIQAEAGVEPRAVKAEPEKEVRLVQKSEAPLVAESANKGVETEIGDEGDVEVKEPPRKEINKRALFSSARNTQDSLAPQTAEKSSDDLKAGHSLGNTEVGGTDGMPTAKLQGRTIMGSLPLPAYTVENEGTVVVSIKVDQYGKVTDAIPGAKGTTVQDAVLWQAAKKAAEKATFNLSQDAPIVQQGSITYIFKLK